MNEVSPRHQYVTLRHYILDAQQQARAIKENKNLMPTVVLGSDGVVPDGVVPDGVVPDGVFDDEVSGGVPVVVVGVVDAVRPIV